MIRDGGVGARVARKEDDRFMRGRGSYVSDMVLPGQSEVAFLRSPFAHGYIREICKPVGHEAAVFVREDLVGLNSIISECSVPGYKLSEQSPLAQGKVRFVGEPLAMTIAPTRAQAEDIAEAIEFDIDDLPAIVDARAARADASLRVHEEWSACTPKRCGVRAKAALQPVLPRERFAQAHHRRIVIETLDRMHICAVARGGKRNAGPDGLSVHHDCAGTTDAVLAS